MHITHLFAESEIKSQINLKVAAYQNLFLKERAELEELLADTDKKLVSPPWSPEELRNFYDHMIKREREMCSQVRILQTADDHFVLKYDDGPDGTGPFKTLEAARQWFLRGGR